jgi:hypothetical protein
MHDKSSPPTPVRIARPRLENFHYSATLGTIADPDVVVPKRREDERRRTTRVPKTRDES